MSLSVVDNLERAAQCHADRCAIQSGDERVSYAQLWERSLSMAGFLQRNGLAPGARVALIGANSAEWVAACYGVLLAGGIAVTLNSAARARDFKVWLQHSGASWLVCDSYSADIAAALDGIEMRPRVLVSAQQPSSPPLDVRQSPILLAEALLGGFRPERRVSRVEGVPAMILYTSGTTGNAKGVLLSHGNLASNCAAILEYLELTEQDSIVTVLPFFYSYGSSVLHTHLSSGARLVLEQNLVYPHLIVEALAREKATGFSGVPSTYALLLARVDLKNYDLSALRYLTQAGGAMPVALVRKLQATLPATRIFVMYGQTEATARLTYLPPASLNDKAGSAGIPIRGVRLEVRTEDGATAPRGEVGEVWVRGPNVMLGYWNNPQATSQAVRDAWLRTGDMGCLDADGFLFLSGRRSDMIKTGAHRVHPADIEEVIAELDGVIEVAVVGVPDEILGQAVKAFVVPDAARAPDVAKLKAHCRDRLAAYKIPKLIELVKELPKTASGKVRRQALAAEEIS